MQKIGILLGVLLMLTACSIRRMGSSVNDVQTAELTTKNVLERAVRQNVTGQDFFIQKAEIEIIGDGGNEKLVANIKFKHPDKYLVSIRNRTGIEAARIYIDADTIMVNDRINRKLFCATPRYLSSKYGISLAVLPVVFGDYIGKSFSSITKQGCEKGVLYYETSIKGIKLVYTLDCEKAKALSIEGVGEGENEGIRIKCEDFTNVMGKYIPGLIRVTEKKAGNEILIRIQKMESPWDGTIEFIPGNRYEIVNLL